MKREVIVMGILLLLSNLYRGFEFWRNNGGYERGDRTFQKHIWYWNSNLDNPCSLFKFNGDTKKLNDIRI